MIKVMSFNIRTAEADDGDNHWQHRKELAMERIRAFAPDLLGLQECHDELQAGFLRAGLPDHQFYGVHRRQGEYNGQEMAPLLVARATFNIRETGCFWLSETPQVVGSLSWNSAYPRTVSWAKLSLPAEGPDAALRQHPFDYEPEAIIGDARCLQQWLGGSTLTCRSSSPATSTPKKSPRPITCSPAMAACAMPSARCNPAARMKPRSTPTVTRRSSLPSTGFSFAAFRVLDAHIDRTRQAQLFPSDHYPICVVLDW